MERQLRQDRRELEGVEVELEDKKDELRRVRCAIMENAAQPLPGYDKA